MEIKDLEVRQGKVEVIAEVVDKGDIREFQKFGKTGKVCTATIKDDSGEIKLSLWNEQVDEVDVGDKIHLTNGYVNEYQGEKQLTTGKFGKIEIVKKSDEEVFTNKPDEINKTGQLSEDLIDSEENIDEN